MTTLEAQAAWHDEAAAECDKYALECETIAACYRITAARHRASAAVCRELAKWKANFEEYKRRGPYMMEPVIEVAETSIRLSEIPQ